MSRIGNSAAARNVLAYQSPAKQDSLGNIGRRNFSSSNYDTSDGETEAGGEDYCISPTVNLFKAVTLAED